MYTKLSFRKWGCFSCHFASLDYTTFGKRTGKPSLRKLNSTAEIIRTRGCSWNKLKWKRNVFCFLFPVLSDLYISIWEGTFKKNSECLAEFCLQGLLSKIAVRHSAQLSSSQGTIETGFHAQTLRGEEPAKTMAFHAGWENRGRAKLLTLHHWEPREGLSPSTQGYGQLLLRIMLIKLETLEIAHWGCAVVVFLQLI